MNPTLLVAAWLTPLLVLPLALRASGRWWAPLAALPALATALLVPVGTPIDLPWLMRGSRLGLGPHDQVFLFFGAVLWLVAGWYAAIHLYTGAQARRFRAYFLLAMSGNFALSVGQGLVSFYLGFSVMGLAAYRLVLHEDNAVVRRASRSYFVDDPDRRGCTVRRSGLAVLAGGQLGTHTLYRLATSSYRWNRLRSNSALGSVHSLRPDSGYSTAPRPNSV